MKKGPIKKKFLTLQTDEETSPMEQSTFSQIGPDGLKFPVHNIKVSKDGTRTSHESKNEMFHSLSKEDLEIEGFLGRGAAGQVQAGILKSSGTRVAVKSINIYDQEKRHQLMNDLSALFKHKTSVEETMACPFLIKLLGAYYDEGSVRVILELMDCGSLVDLIKRVKKVKTEEPLIDEAILARIAQQILNGLMYLHVIGHQIHRDIKPANILINSKGEVKLTDFGIAKELEMTNQLVATQKGTVAYMSPETLKGEKINYLCDIWSFGLVMLELARGQFPYPVTRAPGIIEMLDMIQKDPIPMIPNNGRYTDDFRDFIGRCLEKSAKKRASAIELLSHPWILKNLYKDVDLEGWVKSLYEEPKINVPAPVVVSSGKMEVIDEIDEIQKNE
jgi:serine/threonine protein kinase